MSSRALREAWDRWSLGVVQPVGAVNSNINSTPDASAAEVWQFVLTAATVTVGAPLNPRAIGDQLFVVLIQDATGGRNIAWASGAGGFRNAPTPSAGTSGQRCSFEFRWDGVSWQMTGGSTAFA